MIKKEQGVAKKDYLENDLEKISVDIFHAINENSKEKIHDVQIHTEQSSDDKYYTNCKKMDLIKVMNDPYYEISLVWWFIIITISVMGNYFHFDTHNYMVIFIILGFIFNVKGRIERKSRQWIIERGEKYKEENKTKQEILTMKYNDDIIERFPDTANEPKMLRRQKYAKENVLEQDSLTISKRKNFDPEYFTFKVKILIGDTVETLAEVDSDSMLSLISEKFFNKLKNLQVPMQFLKEQPTQYNGMGGAEMISPLSPFMLQMQIGTVLFMQRMVVSKELKSDILLGSDCMTTHRLSVAPFSDNLWYITLGFIDSPLTRVKAIITDKNRYTLVNKIELIFEPNEIREIKLPIISPGQDKIGIVQSYKLLESPFKIVEDPMYIESQSAHITAAIQNNSQEGRILCRGFPLGTLEFLEKKEFGFHEINLIKTKENDDSIDMEEIEPGFLQSNNTEMEKEIEYIKNHQNIPKQYKQKLTEFLKTVPDLYSGEEFSKEAFPGYEHDIELIDKSISELRAKPYPAQGIRLHQLKSMINDMVKNCVLDPEDSEFLSPVFFVTKKSIR